MFLETSAKTAYNVVEAFNLSASCILNNIEKNGVDPNKINNNIDLKNMNTKNGEINKNGCCK